MTWLRKSDALSLSRLVHVTRLKRLEKWVTGIIGANVTRGIVDKSVDRLTLWSAAIVKRVQSWRLFRRCSPLPLFLKNLREAQDIGMAGFCRINEALEL